LTGQNVLKATAIGAAVGGGMGILVGGLTYKPGTDTANVPKTDAQRQAADRLNGQLQQINDIVYAQSGSEGVMALSPYLASGNGADIYQSLDSSSWLSNVDPSTILGMASKVAKCAGCPQLAYSLKVASYSTSSAGPFELLFGTTGGYVGARIGMQYGAKLGFEAGMLFGPTWAVNGAIAGGTGGAYVGGYYFSRYAATAGRYIDNLLGYTGVLAE